MTNEPGNVIEAIRAKMPLAELARHLGVTRGAVAQWSRVPAERVVEVERITGISREQLRPDLYTRMEIVG